CRSGIRFVAIRASKKSLPRSRRRKQPPASRFRVWMIGRIDINAGARTYASFTIIRCRATAPIANSFRQAKRLPYNSFQIREQGWLRFLVGQRFGALLAAFHDELVERRVDGEGIRQGNYAVCSRAQP